MLSCEVVILRAWTIGCLPCVSAYLIGPHAAAFAPLMLFSHSPLTKIP